MAGSGSLSPMRIRVPNWLDTTGQRNGLCTIRWFWPTGDDAPSLAVHQCRSRNRSRAPACVDCLGDTRGAGWRTRRPPGTPALAVSHMTPAPGRTNSRSFGPGSARCQADSRRTFVHRPIPSAPRRRCERHRHGLYGGPDARRRTHRGAHLRDRRTSHGHDGAAPASRRRSPPPGPRRMGIPLPDRPRHP